LRAGTAASTATRPNVRDDGQRPSFGTGWQINRLICISEKQKYFYGGDWTGQITLIRLDKSDFSRKGPSSPSAQISPKPLTGGSAARREASHALSYFRFRGIADMAAFAAGSTGSRLTLMYGPAVRCKRFVDPVASGLASMYPASDWSVLCSGPSWISARVRSH
jgi:hypothetical protein